eukprot:scaffold17716_cov134-Isochrysis_galbana.AAC.3
MGHEGSRGGEWGGDKTRGAQMRLCGWMEPEMMDVPTEAYRRGCRLVGLWRAAHAMKACSRLFSQVRRPKMQR